MRNIEKKRNRVSARLIGGSSCYISTINRGYYIYWLFQVISTWALKTLNTKFPFKFGFPRFPISVSARWFVTNAVWDPENTQQPLSHKIPRTCSSPSLIISFTFSFFLTINFYTLFSFFFSATILSNSCVLERIILFLAIRWHTNVYRGVVSLQIFSANKCLFEIEITDTEFRLFQVVEPVFKADFQDGWNSFGHRFRQVWWIFSNTWPLTSFSPVYSREDTLCIGVKLRVHK